MTVVGLEPMLPYLIVAGAVAFVVIAWIVLNIVRTYWEYFQERDKQE